MTLSISQWHQRYQQQARWTQNLRKYVYDKVRIQQGNKILDIGCGTGVLENELYRYSPSLVVGLDIDFSALKIAHEYAPNSIYTVGDCKRLPFRAGIFDVTLCHFLLLWVKNPINAIEEMARVTRRITVDVSTFHQNYHKLVSGKPKHCGSKEQTPL
jgi:ubiquinone/menaquinone biosynthesis C-methylase UbiE